MGLPAGHHQVLHHAPDHIVQHILGQPNPEKQGSADPGGCEVSGHRHHLVWDAACERACPRSSQVVPMLLAPGPHFENHCFRERLVGLEWWCYRVEEPETLVELQKNEWDPIIAWAEKRYSMEIGSSTSIMGPSIPAKTREVLVNHLASYNMWALQGIEFIVTQLKSMVLTLGLIDLHLTVEQAVLLSRLEEEYQIQKWGNIEWAHDYELQELRARTAAGALFVHLCSESTTVKHKLLQD
ncbi:ATP synthase mitochondrial F1 complex assembly factor 2 isoform X4 [Lemur catta]|uniref:ATP synthase mitochondrial F1 complex assembly factor 2 isoform X4 n=1 Tax=Lemur catta TaxID=9447 RepID=UPI001E2671F6|nr:ATP synthase mitochondrial F1 complex assembly factor 2 isoform X4 [Lemur catta]